MSTLTIDSVELSSSIRTAGLNSPPSSSDYNETQRETLVDLASLAGIINDIFIPYFNALSSTSADPTDTPIGIQGSTVFSDTTDVSDVFYNSIASQPLCIADSLRLLRAMITVMQNSISDLAVEVQSAQNSASGSGSANLVNVVQQLRNFYNALNTVVSQHTTELQRLSAIQEVRVTTPSIAPGTSTQVEILWPVPYVDDNYTVSLGLESGTGSLTLNSFTRIPGGTGILVLINNTSSTLTQTAIVNVIAQHD